MSNLSSAIIEARKRHEAEIAERLKRRQMRQRAEIERLNAKATEEATAPPSAPSESEVTVPAIAATAPAQPEAVVEVPAATPAPVVTPVDVAPQILSQPAPPPKAASATYDVEKLPDGRFLRLRNDIIDRIKPFLTGNQFAVYMEIYRQTVGRGKTSAWFRTRDIQTACNLGSDNTVRDAYPVLEQKRLIRLDPNRRAGSPKGLLVTVLSVERALDRLERAEAPVQTPRYMAVVPEPQPTDAMPSGPDDLVTTMTRKYGVSPSVAPQLLELVPEADRLLLPYLFARLDRSIANGKVHNPAGLLRVWIESFDAWRAELGADRDREAEAARIAREAASRDELMLEWFKETEARVRSRVDALDEEARAAIRERGRAELLAKSPAVRTWTEQQWETQLDTYLKSVVRRDLDGFDAWLARRATD